jgi:DMAP1-binding Domain
MFFTIDNQTSFLTNYVFLSGDITQKGYEKKKSKILSPFLNSQKMAAGMMQFL